MEYEIVKTVRKITIGATSLSRCLIVNHRPSTRKGSDPHQTVISGKVIIERNELYCQGKGASKRYISPTGIAARAPSGVETSMSSPKPEAADREASWRINWS